MKRQSKNVLSSEVILHGYHIGIFPMADSVQGQIRWYLPRKRAIIPLDGFRVARSLRQVIKKGIFEIRINCNFEQVIKNCAAPREDDEQTWISDEIIAAYTDLHYRGFAHSIESYYHGELAGGLYGVSIGGIFFGESMFYRVSNASKVALHALVCRLRERNFDLLDSQFMNENVKRFGAIELPHDEYLVRLEEAIYKPTSFI